MNPLIRLILSILSVGIIATVLIVDDVQLRRAIKESKDLHAQVQSLLKSDTNSASTNVLLNTIPTNLVVNTVDNGLGAWLTETNHTYGPRMAKNIIIIQLLDGKYYIRFRDDKTNLVALFKQDTPFKSADEARFALAVNMDLKIQKALSDSIDNAFK